MCFTDSILVGCCCCLRLCYDLFWLYRCCWFVYFVVLFVLVWCCYNLDYGWRAIACGSVMMAYSFAYECYLFACWVWVTNYVCYSSLVGFRLVCFVVGLVMIMCFVVSGNGIVICSYRWLVYFTLICWVLR